MSEDDIKQIVDRVLLTIKYAEEPEWNILYDYVTKLQNNWNELKKWLQSLGLLTVVMKMQEIESGNNE